MEEKSIIIKNKENPAVCTYLEFLQNAINRMSTNSGAIKALFVVVYTIFITILIAIKEFDKYWWLGLIISIIGMLMDAYYLALEKMYRKKYNNVVNDLNNGKLDEKQIYNMNPKNTELKYEVIAVMIESIKSFSIIPFYSLFIALTIIIKNV